MSTKQKALTVEQLIEAIRSTSVSPEEMTAILDAAKEAEATVAAAIAKKRQEERLEALERARQVVREAVGSWGFTAEELGLETKRNRRVFPYNLADVLFINNPTEKPHHLAKGVWHPGEPRPSFVAELLNRHYDGDTKPLYEAIGWKPGRKPEL